MTSLIDFLTQRFSEDQQIAKAAADQGGPSWVEDYDRVIGSNPRGAVGYDMLGPVPVHIARHDPARVLREVESKRRIVEWASAFGYTKLMEELALPYRDHSDYREDWAS